MNLRNIKKTILKEFSNWSIFEVSFFLIAIVVVLFCSFYMHDSALAIISALGGITYTILAGKGKVYCYFFGIIGTLACAYLSYEIALYGNFMLHIAYYFPMEVIGFFAWRGHLNKETNEIIKERLNSRQLLFTIAITSLATFLMYLFFVQIGDKSPLVDSSMTVLSILGMVLTVRRSIEQWIVWTLVNFLSVIMWFEAYAAGEKIFSIFLVTF